MELGKCVETWKREGAWDVGKIEKADGSEALHELRVAKERGWGDRQGLRVLEKSLDLIPRAVAMRSFHLTHFPCLSSALLSGMCPVEIFISSKYYYIIGKKLEVREPDEKEVVLWA